ncbi:S-layer homology domain-containing protein [Sporosarcina sp. ITBMC105]
MKKGKQLLFVIVMAMLLMLTIPLETQASVNKSPFKDVDDFLYEEHSPIRKLVERGVISGYGDGTFKMHKVVTRGEFATFLARALDLPEAESSFKDLAKSSALYDGVSRAYAAGIIKGFDDGTIKPTEPVLREEIAVMLDRALQLNGDFTKEYVLDFADRSRIGAYARTSVARVYHYDLIEYYTGGVFAPKAEGSRWTTVKAISKFLDVVEGEKWVFRKSYTEDYGYPLLQEEYVNIKGFVFLKGYDGAWYNELGAKPLAGLPTYKPHQALKKGSPVNVNYSDFANSVTMSAQYAIISSGMNITRQQFIDTVNKVRQTKKPVVINGYKFYINPNGNHPLDILYELQ